MAKKRAATATKSATSLLALRSDDAKRSATQAIVHHYSINKNKVRCDTDDRGYRTPGNRDLTSLVLDASDGFIPLWAPDCTLRWRYKQSSLDAFQNPAAVKSEFEDLFSKALIKWGDAVPVKFSQRNDNYDFQIVVRSQTDCDVNGCVLASSFFPDAGRHEFVIYPTLFDQSDDERVETICHELGHVFGLRHFFAQISETSAPSVIFGKHTKFTIMNYGSDSKLTDDDKADLKRLYEGVWGGEITNINNTPIRLMKPFSSAANNAAVASNLAASALPMSTTPGAYLAPARIITREVVYAR